MKNSAKSTFMAGLFLCGALFSAHVFASGVCTDQNNGITANIKYVDINSYNRGEGAVYVQLTEGPRFEVVANSATSLSRMASILELAQAEGSPVTLRCTAGTNNVTDIVVAN